MPYVPATYDMFSVPNWYKVFPDKHPRWISLDARRLKQHTMSLGGVPGYVPVGAGMDETELKELVEKLGLNESYIDFGRGRIVVGDVMLAWIPESEWQRRVKEKTDAVQDALEVPLERYLDSAKSRAVRPRVFTSEEELQDYRGFATRESAKVGYTGPASR